MSCYSSHEDNSGLTDGSVVMKAFSEWIYGKGGFTVVPISLSYFGSCRLLDKVVNEVSPRHIVLCKFCE